MNNQIRNRVTDALFLKGVSCPLKIFHYRQENRPDRLPFKQRNKLRLRDAVSFRYPNTKFTADDPETANIETEKWLQEQDVTICGAVIVHNGRLTRIPILRKEGGLFTVIQIHGKLRKQKNIQPITTAGQRRSTDVYLLKAAYRVEVLKNRFPDAEIRVEFFFPNKAFQTETANLLQRSGTADEKTKTQLHHLFTSLDATQGVEQMRSSITEHVSHEKFQALTLAEAIEKVEKYLTLPPESYGVQIHKGCSRCRYRIQEGGGCWKQFFDRDDIKFPENHVFELIGHGNYTDAESGFFYQEEVPVQDNYLSFEAIRKTGSKTISIQQRRMLQLLTARGGDTPVIWAKPAIRTLDTLQYPLHFIDFEAATYALPMNRNGKPYDPVLFQFSCHTLYENGHVHHTEWLDSGIDSGYPHQTFVQKLAGINDIYEGTLIQYSPFEGQSLKNLFREFSRNPVVHEKELAILRELRNGGKTPRLFDLSRLIRESYYNSFFNGSLGLKSVLNSILYWMKKSGERNQYPAEIYDLNLDLLHGSGTDPYRQIQSSGYVIEDGAAAMNAYISLKSKNLSDEETKIIPLLLKRYCALDSYALIVIFKHLSEFTQEIGRDEDLVIFKKNQFQ